MIKLLQAGEIRLEAAKAKGFMHGDMGPISDLIDPGDDDLIGSGSFDDQIDHMEARILGDQPAGRATSTAVTTTSRSSTTKNIIKGVETANDLVSSKSKVGLKTALAASSLGFAGGYITNRNSTRR
ncbi:MAG: hypothetical protein O3A39_04005 [Proteobacteria bacterium]|nr:hypothetical protein [Pseudomonadota bacterium]